MVKKHLGNFYLFLVLLFLYLPIVILIVFSFNNSKYSAAWNGFTLKWYDMMIHDEAILKSLYTTFEVAMVSSIFATLIGTMAAVGMNSMSPKLNKFMLNLSYIPMVNPDIVVGVSLLSLFAIFKTIKLGLATLILAHITFCIPYVIFAVLPKLQQLNPHLAEAATDLGATPAQAFFKVILPQIKPGIMSGFLLSFTLSLDDFIVSFFTTGAGISTLSIRVYSMTKRGITPEINALSSSMFVIVLALMFIVQFKNFKSKNNNLRKDR